MADQRIPPDEWRRLQDENGATLASAIGDLERTYSVNWLAELGRDLPFGLNDEELNFSDLWHDVKEVQSLFETLRPIRRDTREEMWVRFNAFRDRARAAQDRQRSRQDALLNDNHGEVQAALQRLENEYDLGIMGTGLFGGRPDLKGFKDDADAVQHLFSTLKLRRADRDDLWGWFSKLRDKVRHIREQNHADWVARQQELICKIEVDIDRSEEFLERLHGNAAKSEEFLERLEGMVTRDEAFRSRLQDQISDLESQRDSAWSDSFIERVGGWISEKEGKVDEVESQIQERRDKIDDVQDQISGTRRKIEDVREQIAEKRERIRDIRARL